MDQAIKWTYLPWEDQSFAGDVAWVCVMIGVIFILVTQIIRHSSLGYEIHEAPFLSMEVTVIVLCINTAAFALFFWYVAIFVSLFFTTVFLIAARGIQGHIYFNEKDGKWGLSPALRTVRGEMYSDLSDEEQLAHKAQVDKTFKKLGPLWYYPLTVLLPFAVMVLLLLCGAPYIFTPHAIL